MDFLTRPIKPINYCDVDNQENGLMGCFVLFLMTRQHRLVSREKPQGLKEVIAEADYTCDWKAATSKMTFSQCFGTQNRSSSSARAVSPVQGKIHKAAIEYLKKNRTTYMKKL